MFRFIGDVEADILDLLESCNGVLFFLLSGELNMNVRVPVVCVDSDEDWSN